MTKWDYIKPLKQKEVSFKDIVRYHLEPFKMQISDNRTIINIKYLICDIIHNFYPFEPTNEIFNRIEVYVIEKSSVQIDFNDYTKYMYDIWNRDKLIVESRIKKLKRIV